MRNKKPMQPQALKAIVGKVCNCIDKTRFSNNRINLLTFDTEPAEREI
jgi:hypothetical protein